MLLQKIYIKGYRNFKEVTVNFNKNSLVIGANDVGKTNLIHAMRLLLDKGFSDYDFELNDSDFYAYEDTQEVIIRIYFTDVTDECVIARMPGKYSDDGEMVIQYKATKEKGKVDYHFYCGKSDNEKDLTEIEGPWYRRFLNLKYISSRRDFWGYINKSKNMLLNQAKDNREPEIIEQDDALYNDIAEKLQYVDKKIPDLSYIKNATDRLNEELDKLSIHNREQRIVFDTSTTEIDRVINSVSLASKCGDKSMIIGGEGRINQIYLSLWATQNENSELTNEVSIICIEEPEAYLHPHQQRGLAAYLSKTLNGQIILTSHSPFIVSEFSPNSIIRLYKKEDETMVASNGCSKIIEDGIDGLGYRMSVIPAEAFFADYVSLIEGPSELLFFKTLASQIGINLDRMNISVLSVDGIDFETYCKVLNAMDIAWALRTDNDIMKIPQKDEYRYAGIERAVACLEKCCIIDEGEKDTIKNNKKLLRGFNNPEDIPEKNREAAKWFIDFLDDYDIQLANVDLETDMMNSPLRDSLKEFYDEDNEMSDGEIIDEMKKHKALNMYHFLQKKKEQLHLLKDDRLAILLISAKQYIESPTPIQRNIIQEEGNTVVLAMPGSGKTFVLSEKIRRILESDVLKDYQGVIAIFYTRKASGHLKRKTLQNGTWEKNSFFGTIDSFCLTQIILPFGHYVIGYPKEEVVPITESDLDKDRMVDFEWINKIHPDYEKINEPVWENLYELFKEGKVLVSSLELVALRIIKNCPACRAHLKARFKYVFIDEFQDADTYTNGIFLELIGLGLIGNAVGDVNQSIFGFAHKVSDYLVALETMKGFTSYKLAENFRCSIPIVNYSNRLLDPNCQLLECEGEMGVKHIAVNGDEKIVARYLDNEIINT